MVTQQQMEDFIINIINWWEGEDCTYCPLHNRCQYEGRDLDEGPPCTENVAKYFLGKLLTND